VNRRSAAFNLPGVAIAAASTALAAAPAAGAPWGGREPLLAAWGIAGYGATVVVSRFLSRRSPIEAPTGGPPVVSQSARSDFFAPTEEALKNLRNPAVLGTCRLASLIPSTLALAAGMPPDATPPTPLEKAQLMRQVLDGSIDVLKKAVGGHLPGGHALRYEIIFEEYVLGRPNTAIMMRLGVSESTFHRQRREAIQALASDLAAREQHLSQGHGISA
jgi:hypothetical protein